MPKTRQEKEQTVKDASVKIAQGKGVVFVAFDKLSVKETEDLRKKCREEEVDYMVVKKRLLKLALEQAGYKDIETKDFDRSVALAVSAADEVSPARILAEFAKDHEGLELQGGILEEKYIDKDEVISLSKIPSRDELLAKMVGSIKAPVSGFVNVLSGNLRGLVQVLSAIKENKI